MKKTFFAFFFVLLIFYKVDAQRISETTTISLLTGSSGTELYNTFGHSAIRVKDTTFNFDTVFNWGTFDFNAPNFYLNFTRGKLLYALSAESYENFKYTFVIENRSVHEQVLDLTLAQKRILYRQLLDNYKPENRYYKYDFFFDNCATRIRDIVANAYGEDFQYNFPDEWQSKPKTFRNLIDLYLTKKHWSDFGIDIALGLPTDAVATPSDYMFLPDYLAEGFATASIKREGVNIPLVKESRLIIPRKDIPEQTFFITPIRLTWALLVIAAMFSYFSHKEGLKTHWFDTLFFTIIGIVGWVVFFLWFLTDHIATKDNLNLLWAVPLYFPLMFFWKQLPGGFKKCLLLVLGGINVATLLLWYVFPQQFHWAFIPLMLIILLRFYFMYRVVQHAE